MPKYKFTRVYLVDAPTQEKAYAACRKNPMKYLTFQSVSVESAEPKQGWKDAVRQQITGK